MDDEDFDDQGSDIDDGDNAEDFFEKGGHKKHNDVYLKNPQLWRVGHGEIKPPEFYAEKQMSEALTMLTSNLRKGILQAHCEQNNFLQHSLDSYNYLVNILLKHIIHQQNPCECTENGVRHVLKVTNIYMDRPSIHDREGIARETRPLECRMRGDTYQCQVYIDMDHEKYDASNLNVLPKDQKLLQVMQYREIQLFSLGAMVGSTVCNVKRHNAMLEEGLESTDGYFVINGSDKVILAQTNLRANKPYIFATKGQMFSPYKLEIRSCHEDRLRSTSTLYMNVIAIKGAGSMEITVNVPFVDFPIPIVALFRIYGIHTHENMMECIVDDMMDQELVSKANSVLDCDIFSNSTIDEIYDYIAYRGTPQDSKEKRIKYMEHICTFEVLPQIGMSRDDATKRKKALYLGYMVSLLLKACLGSRGVIEDNRDDYRNKRLICGGMLIGNLMRQHYSDFIKQLHIKLRQVCNMHIKGMPVDPLIITMKEHFKLTRKIAVGMRYSMATGAFGKEKGGAKLQGVVQPLKNMNRLDAISHGRRNNSHANRDSKAAAARALTPSHWGVQCAVESPEGQACGLVRNQALLCHIRLQSPSKPLQEMCLQLGTKPILNCSREERDEGYLVQINGRNVGYTKHPDTLIYNLRTLRRSMNIPFTVSIAYVPPRQVVITSDAGALMWPVFVVENLPKLPEIVQRCEKLNALPSVLWKELLYNGVIEYLDKEEALNCRVAINPKDILTASTEIFPYTHMEIHPLCIFGVCGSIIPFAEFNQSPRDMYASAMMKQALPAPAVNLKEKMENMTHTLCYPQRPLVETCMERYVNRYCPIGENCIIAFLLDGHTVEDPIIINKGSVDRGRFRSVYRRTVKADNRDGSNTEISVFKKPTSETLGRRRANYDTLDENTGIALPRTQVNVNDVLIGKIITSSETRMQSANSNNNNNNSNNNNNNNNNGQQQKRKNQQTSQLVAASEPQGAKKKYRTERDTSMINKYFDGTVSNVTKIERDSTTVIKSTIQSMRIPEEGDKFSSRHGQKGTMSHLRPEVDMPFDPLTGMSPDILVNCHALPSRMTIGQKMEMVTALYAVIEGKYMDATPFDFTSEEEVNAFIQHMLAKIREKGYNNFAERRLCNGTTGEMMEASVFVAPCYYLRLRHVVADKIHARRNGPIQILTRQPVEGRGREGGLRIGTMEFDNFKTHGASYVAKDSMANRADPWQYTVCSRCGLMCEPANPTKYISEELRKPYCRNCKTHENIEAVAGVYAYQLTSHEMESLNMAMRNRFESLSKKDREIFPQIHDSLDAYLEKLQKEDPNGTINSVEQFIDFKGLMANTNNNGNDTNNNNNDDDDEIEKLLAKADSTTDQDLVPPQTTHDAPVNLLNFKKIFHAF